MSSDLPLPELPSAEGLLSESARGKLAGYLASLRDRVRRWTGSGVEARAVAARHADGMDRVVGALFEASRGVHPDSDPVALIATGGWGRRELSPYSDLDLLFLLSPRGERGTEERIERILYPLWDLGLDVSHAVRTPGDSARLARDDLRVATSLLEARPIRDEAELGAELRSSVREILFAGGTHTFVAQLREEQATRVRRFADSIYLLEPNLKSGEGGLRDLNVGRWAARAAYDAEDFVTLLRKGALTRRQATELEAALEWYLSVRATLHLSAGRRQDRLTFEHQEIVAKAFGFTDTSDHLAAEQLMREYYRHARAVATRVPEILERAAPRSAGRPATKTYIDSFFRLHGGQLAVADPEALSTRPSTVVEAFRVAQQRQVPIHPYTRERIAEAHSELADLIASDPEPRSDRARERERAHELLIRLLTDSSDRLDALTQMHELGVLGALLPEFAQIEHLWRRDLFHVYTVDVHSLHAVGCLRELVRGELAENHPRLSRIARETAGPDARPGAVLALYLGMLLHDCGKAHGPRHTELGEQMARTAALRLGLPSGDADTTALLVRHHLLMSHVATKRDLSDETLISEFGRAVGTQARLDALYLLTFADMSSVGPGVLSRWSAMLLDELYGRARESLLRGTDKAADTGSRLRAARERLRRAAGELPLLGGRLLTDFLESADERHLLGNDADTLVEHLMVLHRQEQSDEPRLAIGTASHGSSNLVNIMIACDDTAGLLASLAGTLTANGLDILSARIYSLTIGGRPVALDVFHVDHPGDPERLARSGYRWARLERDLRSVLAGEVDVAALIRRRASPAVPRSPRLPQGRHRVAIDNEVSGRYTVIDVHTEDRPGVLYAVAATLHRLGMSIVISLISTEAEEASDAFYVIDAEAGGKVRDPERLERVRTELLQAVQRLLEH